MARTELNKMTKVALVDLAEAQSQTVQNLSNNNRTLHNNLDEATKRIKNLELQNHRLNRRNAVYAVTVKGLTASLAELAETIEEDEGN